MRPMMRFRDLNFATRTLMWPWCGAVVAAPNFLRPEVPLELACTRKPGHLGGHVATARDAWYADRHAGTNGYRRQRRQRGYKRYPPRWISDVLTFGRIRSRPLTPEETERMRGAVHRATARTMVKR